MNRPISTLLRLYPRSWQARYESEFRALMAEAGLTPETVVDIARAALDAHLSGDYPSAPDDGRKVHAPMSRLTWLATALCGLTFIALFAAMASGVVDWDGSPISVATFLLLPVSLGLLALGIALMSIRTYGVDGIARGLGLAAAALTAGFAVLVFSLMAVGATDWMIMSLLVLALSVATGLAGARIALVEPDRRDEGIVLAIGLVAALAWVVGMLAKHENVITSVGLPILGWVLAALLGLRRSEAETA